MKKHPKDIEPLGAIIYCSFLHRLHGDRMAPHGGLLRVKPDISLS
jgi:hypothetical protein